MCRSHIQGHRRCKGSAATKAQESLRKAVNYQAKKAGLSPKEWKDQNPELLEIINKSYDERLNKFEQKLNSSKNSGGFIDSDGETLLTGAKNPAEEAKLRPIGKYDFAAKGEKRMGNSQNKLSEYLLESESYIENNLKLEKYEKHAVLCYTNDMYLPLNRYFLNKSVKEIFNKDRAAWKDSEEGYQMYFSDEEDLIDCAQHLDSALSHRSEEKRIVYRGLGVRQDSGIIRENNDGKEAHSAQERRAIMENVYKPNTELSFDSYSSASESINIASDWSGSHATWGDPPTGIIFEIKSSAGIPVAYLSGHDSEREILLPRGMKFKVANSYWNGDTDEDCYKYDSTHTSSPQYAKNPNVLIVQLVEVDEQGSEISDGTTKYEAPPINIRSKSDGTEDKNV